MRLIYLFFISAFLSALTTCCFAQEVNKVSDTVSTKAETFGLRLGIDLSKPIRTLIDENYTGFEIMADFRVYKKFYVAIELGNEEKDLFEENLNSSTSGSYAKIGIDFDANKNWIGLHNNIIIGMRYGISSFKQNLISYGVFTTNQTFTESQFREDAIEFDGLSAQWVELIFGIKTELFDNFYLSLHLELKQLLNEDLPTNFDNLYIPGFNKTNDHSDIGVGYGYSISYLIPLFKK